MKSPAEIFIWRAARADAETLAQLEREAFGARSWGARGVKDSLSAPRATTLFAGWTQHQPRAFAIWRDLGEDAEILSIGVAADMRGRGLAGALLARAIEEARLAGCAAMFLEVDSNNDSAHALYKRAGFTRIGRRARYYKDGADALIMRLDI